jgi:hypothetical protein
MRALWSVVIVCLVAATGVRPTPAPTPDEPASVAPAAAARISRSGGDAPRYTAQPRAPRPSLPSPPPGLIVAAFALRPPVLRAVAHRFLLLDRVPDAIHLTRFARGPPVG